MAEFKANAIQTVVSRGNVLFTDSTCSRCNSISHRLGSGLITLKGNTDQCRARYKVTFGANVGIPTTGTAAPCSLAMAIDGEPILSSTVITTSATTGTYNAVDKTIYIDIPCGCCAQLSIMNTTGQSINVQNAVLIVERVA